VKKFFAWTSILALVFAVAAPHAANASSSTKDFSGSTEYHLVPCLTATELDCVESFGFINKAGQYVPATATVDQPMPAVGQNDNPVIYQQSHWSAQVDGKLATADLDVPLQSPKYVIFKNSDGSPHYGASLRPWVNSPDLLNTHVRLKIRTSFLIPQNVQLVAEDSDFSQTAISGGNLWMFEGKGTPVSNYTTDWQAANKRDFSAPADMDTSTLHFIIHHGDPDLTRGYWPAECGDKGYTVQAFNSNSAGSPFWNAQNKSLDFAIQSPHTMASGAPNLGFFKLWTTDAFIDCKWPGNTLSKSPQIEVRVVSEDGVTQVSTNQVSHKDGKIFVFASGFHYSSPTIKLVAVGDSAPVSSGSQSTPTPTSTPAPTASAKPAKPSVTTIKCLKGKTLKKVSAVAPKCPAGFKLTK
jgi:hypothetical protein